MSIQAFASNVMIAMKASSSFALATVIAAVSRPSSQLTASAFVNTPSSSVLSLQNAAVPSSPLASPPGSSRLLSSSTCMSHRRSHLSMRTGPSSEDKRSSSSSSNSPPTINFQNIDKEQMEEILQDFEANGREGSGYCVVDVRSFVEVQQTGPLSPNVPTLPVEYILYERLLECDDEEDFEEVAKFPKPKYDETLVFTCAAGIRSMAACRAAAQAGYTKLINYRGGAYDWFASR